MVSQQELEGTWRWPLKKVTISRWLYELVRRAGVASDEVLSIPIAVDHQQFQLTTPISARDTVAAMMYGVGTYKATDDGIRALEILRAHHQELEAVVFGPRRWRPRDLPGWIIYRGQVSTNELAQIYNASQIFICSSVAEGFALPPAEAMACGCAVVATDCGGISEYAVHEVNSLLSPPRDPEALASNALRLLEDNEMRQRLAQAGQRRIQQLTWEHSTEMLEAFIKKSVLQTVAS
jgi:glycosyltransferase involved in cell wall biosynthesis